MEQLLGILAALTIGIVLGSVSAWLILRGQLATIEARVKSESQVDMARLNERLTGSQEAVTRAEARHAAFESLTNTLRSQLNESSSECAQLSERASRVDGLERDLSIKTGELTAAQEESTRFAAQLAERTEALQAEQGRILGLITDRKVDREKFDTLQERLQQEAERAVGLAEQNSRLPELTKSVEAAMKEVALLQQNQSGLREKLGAAESTVTSQAEHLTNLHLEKDNLATLRDRLTAEQQRLSAQVAELTTTLGSERTQTEEKLQLLKGAEEQLSNRFKTLANEILEEKSQRFTNQNQTNIVTIQRKKFR